jgi:transposase
MERPPALPADEKLRIVLAVVSGRSTISKLARECGVSETSVCNWKKQFLEGGHLGLTEGLGSQRLKGGSGREAELKAENKALKTALREAVVQVRVWKMSAEGHLGPSETSR